MPALPISPRGILRAVLAWTVRLAVIGYFAAGTLILAGRYLLMPEINGQREVIERQLAAAVGLPVSLSSFKADWPGLYPHLSIEGVQIHDRAGLPVLRLDRVEVDIGWTSLLYLSPRLHRLEIIAPRLDIHRAANGELQIAGLPVRGGDDADSGFVDWLLAQHRVVIRDASIVWRDTQRGAAPLELRHLDFDLRNFGRHHGFGLTAEPPADLATRLDVRGNLSGRTWREPKDWQGELYAAIESIDLAAWAPWIDWPCEIRQGRGSVRGWFGFANLRPGSAMLDVDLTDFDTRLRPELRRLSLARLEGRVAARREGKTLTGEVRQLSLTTTAGIVLPATDITARYETGGRRQGGEFRANGLDLGALAGLADHLPLPEEFQSRLNGLTPRGRLSDLALTWKGTPEAPTGWQLKSRFDDLALAAYRELPGFAGISGRLEGNEGEGRIQIDSRQASILLPAVFPEPILTLARVEADLGWRVKGGGIDFQLARANFFNEDAQGEASGSYRHTGQGLGEIDLQAKLTRAAGNAVWRYMPLVVNKDARDWLRAAILGGRADSATLRLKGPLDAFPFQDGKHGIFQVKGGFRGATLHYAPDWPVITEIDGDLLFEGARMLIRGHGARLSGADLAEVRAEIPDLGSASPNLIITGKARGETQRFLDFIEASPVGTRIDHFTESLVANGTGELDLRLDMPLRHVIDTQVQGRYRFAGNRLQVLRQLPPFTEAQGELGFTADRLQAKNLRARLLDHPMSLELVSAPGGTVRVNASGILAANSLRQYYNLPALDHLSGETPWRAQVTVKRPGAEVRVESGLEGLTSSLPEPFNKSGPDPLPLRVTGRIDPQGDQWTATLGEAVALQAQPVGETWRGRLAIGAAAVKTAAALPARGLALAVTLPALDVDLWRALVGAGQSDEKASTAPLLTAIEVQSPAVRLMRRDFHEVRLQGADAGGRWRFDLDSREAQGQLQWEAGGGGRISGHLARLSIPTADEVAQESTPDDTRELPAIDLNVDALRLGEHALGELKVKAENRDGQWLARFDLKNSAAALTGDGRWQFGRHSRHSALNFKLDIDDGEKLLGRLGMPDAMRRGSGRIEGELSWNGAPFSFDPPTLSGHMKVDFGKGQFKKVEPGVGRLLGVLSLQSLPRRISLDFRDVFSEGFAFDHIGGEAQVKQGTMTTSELRIRGPAATVLLSGAVNLAEETQDLQVRVLPAIGETLAVGAMIAAHPIAGAVAWAAQKILDNPLDRVFAYDYAITGSWNDPKVDKVPTPPREPKPENP